MNAKPNDVAYASVNGVDLYFEVHGAGEPVLLLHGGGGAGLDWAPLVEDWSARFRLIVPDLRGHGRSGGPDGAFRHAGAAADIGGLLDRLGIERCKGMGVSAGGNVLLHLATARPSRIEAMVLVSATSHFPDQARAIMRAHSAAAYSTEEREQMLRRHPGGAAQIERLAGQMRAMAEVYDDMAFSPSDLATITARTLIVQGDSDPLYPIEISQQMARAIPGASLRVVDGGGHAPIGGERWPEFVRTAFEWLTAEGR